MAIFWIDTFIAICLCIFISLGPEWMIVSKASCNSTDVVSYHVPPGHPSIYVLASGVSLTDSNVKFFAKQKCLVLAESFTLSNAVL